VGKPDNHLEEEDRERTVMLKWFLNKWVVMKWIEVWLAHWDRLLLLIVCQPSDCTRKIVQLAFKSLLCHLNSVVS
jgi:hypothetical protein